MTSDPTPPPPPPRPVGSSGSVRPPLLREEPASAGEAWRVAPLGMPRTESIDISSTMRSSRSTRSCRICWFAAEMELASSRPSYTHAVPRRVQLTHGRALSHRTFRRRHALQGLAREFAANMPPPPEPPSAPAAIPDTALESIATGYCKAFPVKACGS